MAIESKLSYEDIAGIINMRLRDRHTYEMIGLKYNISTPWAMRIVNNHHQSIMALNKITANIPEETNIAA